MLLAEGEACDGREVRWAEGLETMSETNREVWIGLVEVRPVPGNAIFGSAPGAYSNALCLARSEDEYRFMVEVEFGKLGLEVMGFEDIEPLERRRGDRRLGDDVPREVLELAGRLSDAAPVLYDTFYVYESEADGGDAPSRA